MHTLKIPGTKGLGASREFLLYMFLLVGFTASFLLHFPDWSHSIYSDLIGVYYRVYGGEGWYNSVHRFGFPYVDYMFEYPPVVGVLWSVSTLPRMFLPGDEAVYAHYVLQALFTGLAAFYLGKDLLWLSDRLERRVPVYLLFLMPSFIVYSVYNWDIIAIALGIRGLRYFLEDRKLMAGVFFGLALGTKVYPGLIVLAVLRERGRRALGALYFTIATSLALMFIMFIHPRGFMDFVSYHFNWIIEGSWWLLLARGLDDRLIIGLAKLAMTLSLVLALVPRIRGGVEERIIIRSWLVITAPLLFSYVYSPQMNLMVIPLTMLLASPDLLAIIALQDLAAATVILTWFSSSDPLDKFSIPSIASYIKCLLLAVILAVYIRRYIIIGEQRSYTRV